MLCSHRFSEKMGSEFNPGKPRYDITMSRRTRKPLNLQEAANHHQSSKWEIPALKTITSIFDQSSQRKGEQEEESESDRKSLKQLINGDEIANEMSRSGRSSLSHHFTEEQKQLQLVKKNQDNSNNNGVNLKGMVSRYAKVLSHMVKIKREPRIGPRKKRVLRLTM